MTCEQCLTHLPPGGAFCPNCGHPAPAGDGRPADAQAWGLLQVAVGLAVVLFAAIIVSGGVDLLFGEGNLAWGVIAGSALLGLAMAGMPAVAAIGGSRQVPLALGLTVPQLPFPKTAAFTAAALGLSMGATALYSWAVRALDVGILVPPEIPGVLVLPGAGAVLTFAALAVLDAADRGDFLPGVRVRRVGQPARHGPRGGVERRRVQPVPRCAQRLAADIRHRDFAGLAVSTDPLNLALHRRPCRAKRGRPVLRRLGTVDNPGRLI